MALMAGPFPLLYTSAAESIINASTVAYCGSQGCRRRAVETRLKEWLALEGIRRSSSSPHTCYQQTGPYKHSPPAKEENGYVSTEIPRSLKPPFIAAGILNHSRRNVQPTGGHQRSEKVVKDKDAQRRRAQTSAHEPRNRVTARCSVTLLPSRVVPLLLVSLLPSTLAAARGLVWTRRRLRTSGWRRDLDQIGNMALIEVSSIVNDQGDKYGFTGLDRCLPACPTWMPSDVYEPQACLCSERKLKGGYW
ncbi:hypothetical protein FKP32DRAFT_1604294 [Trametes sanguinea]|nr:hypothetical protein FKP32DRAFT_1604294 [Trametes sanguinea]